MVALVDARLVALGRLDREPNLDDAAVEHAGGPEADVLEHREHGLVLGQDLRDERLDAVCGCTLRELLEEAGADALALEVVGDCERGLGRAGVAEADVVPDRHDPLLAGLAHDADQRSLLRPVGRDEGAHEAVAGQREAVEAEEAAADRQFCEERHERRNVVLHGSAQTERGAVAQDDVDGHTGIVPEIGHTAAACPSEGTAASGAGAESGAGNPQPGDRAQERARRVVGWWARAGPPCSYTRCYTPRGMVPSNGGH